MRRFTRLLLTAALLYGTGAHWAAVQGAGWVKMIADRASTQGLAGAVATTFDGKSPCGVCIVVDKGARPEQPERVSQPSVHLIAVGGVAVVTGPTSSPFVITSSPHALARDFRPASPPPKAALLT